ncbi:MAG: tandem-95 repeat protein, partial [Pseudomonadota bacterium]
DLLANDADVDGDALTIVSVQDAVNGTVALDGAGDVVFTPDADYHGPASFTYTVSDGALTSTATASLTIAPVNDAPVAADDSGLATDEDTALTIAAGDLLANDADVDGDALTIVSVQDAVNGTVALDGAGDVVFTPDADYHGPASFTYTVSDGSLTSTATASLTVAPVNDAPVAADDAFDAGTDTVFTIPASVLLANDTDVEGNVLGIVAVQSGPGFTAALDGGGNVQVQRDPQLSGQIALNYTVSDGDLTDQATVTIDLIAANSAPEIAEIAPVTSPEDEDIIFDFPADVATDPDGDVVTLSVARAGGSALPSWLTFDAGAKRLSGTPPLNFNGVIALELSANDGEFTTTREFDLVIDPVNDAPDLSAPYSDHFSPEDQPFQIELQRDLVSDVDGDQLSYDVRLEDGSPLSDWISFDEASFSLVGTPPPDFAGSTALRIYISDGQIEISDDFNLVIVNLNDTPVAEDDFGFDAVAGQTATIDDQVLLENDTDPDGDTLTIVDVQASGNATVAIDVNGNIAYTPLAGFEGDDTFYYTVSDGAATAQAEVTVNVVPDDVINGTDGSDILIGDNQDNTINGNGGNDVISGQRGHDTLNGGTGHDAIFGGSGRDTISGGSGNDLLFGNRGRDVLNGDDGNDYLFGDRGRDSLSGGLGNDLLVGGQGRDTFYFSQGDGRDIIADFGRVHAWGRRMYINGDEIAIDVDGIESFEDLMGTASQQGRNVVFDFGNGDELVLAHTRLAALDKDAFTFF